MNINEIIKTINESIGTTLDVSPSVTTFDVPIEVVKALADLMGEQKPEDLLKLIIQLTTDVEKKRLGEVNRMLRAHESFNKAMAGLHAWRSAQPTPPQTETTFGELIGRVTLVDEDAEALILTAGEVDEGEGRRPVMFLQWLIPHDNNSTSFSSIALDESKAKQLHALLGQGIDKLWPRPAGEAGPCLDEK